ncbi:MAG: Zn-dependent exopeptidase M28, partial [Lentisphaerae bacterium]|nr:Zn-dependent exopeptidase M28 [Lentisphaerota bacterium]
AAQGSTIPGVTVTTETFPVWERAVESELLQVEIGGQWYTFASSLFGAAPSTGGAVVEAPLVFFDSATGYQQSDLSFMKGAAVVHLGCHIESAEQYQRLIEAEPAFLLFVDIRFPGDGALADGLFPAYVHAYGARTTVNVAYHDVWRWRREGATRARLCVKGERRRSESQNVVLEIAGSDPAAGVIYLGAHHDTQAGTVGADDNAIGCASLLELARLLAESGLRHTVRLVSFGAEEQLSLGSAAYVRRHRAEVAANGRFMYNIDGSASALGWLVFTMNSSAAQESLLREVFTKHGFTYELTNEPCPYTDQFPFAAAGVPGLWVYRKNCVTGVYYHHRYDDIIANLDLKMAARQLDAAVEFLTRMSGDDAVSAQVAFSESEQRVIDTLWETICGGWGGFTMK